MKKIKVLYVQVFAGGGSLNALYEMLKKMDLNQIEPFVICYHNNSNTKRIEALQGCKVFYPFTRKEDVALNIKASNSFRLLQRIKSQINILSKYLLKEKSEVKIIYEYIQKIQPDIVHQNNGLFINRASVRAASKAGVIQVMHTRGISKYKKYNANYFLDYLLKRKISAWIFYTPDIKNYFKNIFHLEEQMLYVFSDFIDIEIYKKKLPNKQLLEEFKIKEKDFVITDIGRIIEWKGQHVLIEAIEIIKNKLQNFKVLLVGSEEKNIGSETYFKYLKKLINNNGLENLVLLTGNRNDISSIINLSEVIVHTAIKPEPQGLVIIEALLCKKPVIATNAGGAAEIVKKYGGFLVTPGKAEELARLLLEMYNNYQKNIPFSTHIDYDKLITDFDSEKQMHEILTLYKKLISKNNLACAA